MTDKKKSGRLGIGLFLINIFMSFENHFRESEEASNPSNPEDNTANVQKFWDYQQPSDLLGKNKEWDTKNNKLSELPKPLDQKALSNIREWTAGEKMEAMAMIPKDNDLWPPVTIESSVGWTEWGKNIETKNA